MVLMCCLNLMHTPIKANIRTEFEINPEYSDTNLFRLNKNEEEKIFTVHPKNRLRW
jgi:hypothetical protein